MEIGRHQHTIPSILAHLIGLVNDLQRRNMAMIMHYVYPNPTPTEIAAYEPRLLILQTRIESLFQLNLQHLSFLIDDAAALVASYVRPNVSQLAASSVGIQEIFINHYDRGLAKSLPYDSIHATLIHYEELLHDFLITQMEDPNRQPAEELVPPPSPKLPSLCHGAIAFMNDRDHGRVSSVAEKDLLPQHHKRLADQGGVVLWWECSVCAFRIRYHASSSVRLNIDQTDEVVTEEGVLDIAYRSAWLAKCHIYHPHRPKDAAPSPPISPAFEFSNWDLPPIPPLSPDSKQRPRSTPKRVSFSRRKSSSTKRTTDDSHKHEHKHKRTTSSTARMRTISPSPPPHAPFPPTRPKPRANTSAKLTTPISLFRTPSSRLKSILKPTPTSASTPKPTPNPSGPNNLRYFCPFCIAQGRPLSGTPYSFDSDDESDSEPTCFEDSAEFMAHIDDLHTRNRPASLMLLGLKVAVDGQMAPGPERGVGRWDLDLRS